MIFRYFYLIFSLLSTLSASPLSFALDAHVIASDTFPEEATVRNIACKITRTVIDIKGWNQSLGDELRCCFSLFCKYERIVMSYQGFSVAERTAKLLSHFVTASGTMAQE